MEMHFPLDYEADIDDPVFSEELGPWLPEAIFDFHSHVYRPEDVSYTKKASRDPSMPTVCEAYPIENYLDAMGRMFPGKELHALLFNTIDPKADLARQNSYLAEVATRPNMHALMVGGVCDDEAKLEEELRAGGFLGLKPYWSYVTWKSQADVTLEDMIPPAQRRLADRLGLILMVHIPRLGRLADPVNVEGLERLCRECPGAKVIMAHFGRSYFPEAVGDLGNLPAQENLLVDFSMVQDWEVCQILIERFGPKRILFGLDMPVAQERGKLVSANGQRHFFTKRIHPWSIHNSAGSYRMRCTFFAYEIVRAFKKAAERTGLTSGDVRDVFLQNALDLVAEVEGRVGAQR